jgi:hypothetical protein
MNSTKLLDNFLLFFFSVEIDYSSVRRMPTVKLSGQAQSTTITTMPMSTSLQDINTCPQKFVWKNSKEKDEQLISFSG